MTIEAGHTEEKAKQNTAVDNLESILISENIKTRIRTTKDF